MVTISPTQLKTYLECPRYYWWYYINPQTRWQYPARYYFTMGNHIHKALGYFFSLPPAERTKQVLLASLEQEWETATGARAGFKTREQEEECREKARLMLSAFYDREDVSVTPLWVRDDTLRANVSEELGFKGKIDRIDGMDEGLHIIDYKTGKEREDEWQLPIYAIIASRYFRQPVRQVSYLFLETGSWVSQPINSAREAATIARVSEIIKTMPRSAAKTAWQCPLGEACTHCDYLHELGISEINPSPSYESVSL